MKRLVQQADILLESFSPGYMDSLGLGYTALSEINQRLVMTSITPFGQDGPYSDYKASDLGCMAASGYLYICGEPERAPVRLTFPQSYSNAGGHAAMGSLIAYYYCQQSGEGQHVDVSIQESVSPTLHDTLPMWYLNNLQVERAGTYRIRPPQGLRMQQVWCCRDGFVFFGFYGGLVGVRNNQALVEWMESEGAATPALKEMNWAEFDLARVTPEKIDELQQPIAEFFSSHSVEEICAEGMKRRILLSPVNTVKQIREYNQLAARDFWIEVEHPELGSTIVYPGAFAKTGGGAHQIRRAPHIGEHNSDIYQKLGFSTREIIALKESGVI